MAQDHPAGGDQAELKGRAAWICDVCGYVYDEAEGSPGEGIAAGTAWADVPADWCCPECGVGKEDFTRLD